MPGFILHMLHGNMFLKKSNLHYSPKEINQFRMGLLMPDANKVKKRKENDSHFFSPNQDGMILQVPDLDNFNYRILINEPFVLGYAAHLYLDKFFFEDYFQQFVHFLDYDDRVTLESAKVSKVFLVKSHKYISLDELFSEEYLYGDYTALNQYLVKKYCLKMIETEKVINPIKEVDINDFDEILNALERYLKDSSENMELKVFTSESIEKAIEKYAFGFDQWVKGVKSVLCFFQGYGD